MASPMNYPDQWWQGQTLLASKVEQLMADNARLAAEVERLTPKPTSADDVPNILNAEKYEDCTDWTWDGCQYIGGYVRAGLDFVHSQYLSGFAGLAVAEKLVRDTGPIAAPLEPDAAGKREER